MNAVNSTPSRRRKPRLRDIAAYAQVSIGTVSRVLNGKPDVQYDLVERVTKAATEMGYDIRAPKKNLSLNAQNLGSIGYIVDPGNSSSLPSEPFQQHFLSGIEQAIVSQGGHLIFSTCRNEILKDSIPSMIQERLVSGVILKAFEETPESWIRKISDLVPTVLLMHRNYDLGLSSAMCDNHGAVYRCLQYLKEELGHTKIGFFYENEVSPRKNSMHHDERLAAFIKYSAHFGLPILPGYIQAPSRNTARSEDLSDVASTALKNFMALGDRRPTAVIGAADIYALALMRAAQGVKVDIPGDLSVIGIMDTEACEFSNPTLTSISLSEMEIGHAAVDLLSNHIARPQAAVRMTTVGAHLVKRESCALPGRRRR